MTDIYLNAKRYRLNVGVVVFNREGKVWLGRRAEGKGQQIWQFPQGGVDGQEDLLDAARRELHEETGIASVSLIARAKGWITYDFPEGFMGSKAMKGFAGQTQAWFAFRFEGEDAEIDLAAYHQIEFDAWRWADIHEAQDLVVPFKRDAYLKVIEAFAPIAAGQDPASADAGRGALLMIHGLGCTGRVWERMAAGFKGLGWTVETPTLRAHLRTVAPPDAAGAASLAKLSLSDYVAEAQGWARSLEVRDGRPPVLIGHSMGGLIVQKLLERGVGRAGVLLTPAAPADVKVKPALSALFILANVLLKPKSRTDVFKVWRRGIEWGMLNRTPKPRHVAIHAQMVHESGRVLRDIAAPGTDTHRTAFVDEGKVRVPILTIAAGKDRTVPPAVVEAVGRKYETIGGDYRAYPNNAHWIVDEPGTDQVVAHIDAWLGAKLG